MIGLYTDRIARAALFAFGVQWVVLDLALRGLLPYRRDPQLLLTAVASILLSHVFGHAVRGASRAVRVVVSLILGSLVVIDVIVFRHYRVPLDAQVIETALFAWSDVRPVAISMLPGAGLTIAIVAAFEYGLLAWAARGRFSWRVRTHGFLLALGAALLVLGGNLRDGTLEVRLADAATLAWEPDRASVAGSVRVAPLGSRKARLPNVLFVLTESVRASDYCSNYDPGCEVAPRVGALLPQRVPLHGMRAVASYTAVSVSALLTGRSQMGPRAEILGAPTLFDLLKAVRGEGAGGKPKVVYWSAQSEQIFERSDLRGVFDSFVTMETLLGHAVSDEDEMIDRGVDRMLAAHVAENLPNLALSPTEPYFVMLHFGGTHAPYFVDEEDAPFRPWEKTVTWASMPLLHNAYRNAIFEQDKSIASCISLFLKMQGDAPWMIIFTSDHGEAFGEHGAIHHGQNLYDEQTHVPGWIAYGNGALDPAQERQLRTRENEVVTHLDLLPTILDAYGVMDTLAMVPHQNELRGRSLLREDSSPRAPIPITNCTEMFPCPVNTWGMLGTERLLVAQPWDNRFRCTNVRNGLELGGAGRPSRVGGPSVAALPRDDEKIDPGGPAVAALPRDDDGDVPCRELVEASKSYFSELPNHAPNR